MRLNKGARAQERGNAFFVIFLGVVLFAALIFTISSGLNTGTSKMSAAQARNQATDIITYSQQIERAVKRIYTRGISEGDISFENATVTGYAHTPAVATKALVFNGSDGGFMTWRAPMKGSSASATNTWLFTGGVVLTGQGNNSKSDLMMVVPVTSEICTEINRQLNTGIDTSVSVGTVSGAKFTGTYTDNPATDVDPGVAVSSGCVKGLVTDGVLTGTNTFFKVLLAR
jgi:hypothetical protein